MFSIKQPKRDGTGKGQGRKSLNGSGESKVIRARVSDTQAETFEALGGAAALREWLDEKKQELDGP